MSLDQALRQLKDAFPITGETLPTLFVGHGNPMNAIEDNPYSRAWEQLGAALPNPKAILCVSAHWETQGTQVTAMEQPRTIHDFGGFPPELFAVEYPAPGSPELAELARETLSETTPVGLDQHWGLDHGAWSVLCRMFPAARVPVVQLSLDRSQSPAFHYALGRELRSLRERGVLVVSSGNVVHNLRQARWVDVAADWALAFDSTVKERILTGDHEALVDYIKLGQEAQLSIPTNEHYLPLLYTLGMQHDGEGVSFFSEHVTLNSISMRTVLIGG
ncbi:4,5-DOPA dioxygenase extradiol [Armatimonas rosea]|uniref:4,5-DOPA dioxygenase extradiol n=1 Tax=Armatimonas rosea TaxID=685828 RepID=A0A7W9SSA9_ARMRO|nr:4,5-DOPA dioxygenase extradiol [Armatimonas rosea]MBB6051926.1 4,5-DOPA dioxygenase extradiol [Armatimonas rosea]